MEKKDLSVMSVEEVGNWIMSLPRKDIRPLCKELNLSELHKVILGMMSIFDFEAKKFQEKKNQSAGLRSRKVTADLQGVFLEWRRRTLHGSMETVEAPK